MNVELENAAPPPVPSPPRAAAWRQLTRTAQWLVLLAAGIAIAGLAIAVVTDGAEDQAQARSQLQLRTDAQAHALAMHLSTLGRELNRLGLHSEIDLRDQNLEPERTLLRLAHGHSTFFNVGVALVDTEGNVAWSEPESFLAPASNLAQSSWFRAVQGDPRVRLAPVRPERDDALIYVVSPVVRKGAFAGALIGAVDLAAKGELIDPRAVGVEYVLAGSDGSIIYPGRPPPFARDAAWRDLFPDAGGAWTTEARLGGVPALVAATAVPTTDLVLAAVAPVDELYAPARRRLALRLAAVLVVAFCPLALVVVTHRRALQRYRRAEEIAVRNERLAHLGSAANVIAHEVKNALNGISMGIDLMMRQQGGGSPRVVEGVRAEIGRLTAFTTELLLFSRGIHPRPVAMDLAELARRAAAIAAPVAEERGIALHVVAEEPVPLRGDPGLLHVVVSNLVSNAIDAASSSRAAAPAVEVRVERRGGRARLAVRDDGPGVPAGIRDSLFEPFVSGKPTGTGIGLSISRSIAEAHGGTVALERSDDRGSVFVLTVSEGLP